MTRLVRERLLRIALRKPPILGPEAAGNDVEDRDARVVTQRKEGHATEDAVGARREIDRNEQ